MIDDLHRQLAEALRRLQTAQMMYRKNHDLYGDDSIETGMAWDKLRWAGYQAKVSLEAYDATIAAEQHEAERATEKLT